MSLVAANIELLEQGARLLRSMEGRTYRRQDDGVFGTSVSSHIRHNLDHYTQFLNGLAEEIIDYQQRSRDTRIETCPEKALAAIREVIERLSDVSEACRLLRVRLETSSPTDVWDVSSVRRELDFLVSHTVHHYALIGVICRNAGIAVEPGFGVAPSTLRHLASCARSTGRRRDVVG